MGNGADVKWSFRVATIAGIQVRVHATFLLLLGYCVWLAYLNGSEKGGAALGVQSAHTTVVFMLLLFLCVLLHEFGHAFAALAFGIRTPDITLLPIGGLARLEKMPTSPWQEFVIAVAGPAVNVAIVGLLLPITGLPGDWAHFQSLNPENGGILLNVLKLNCVLIAFNMIPAFPMDGGRVLRALLATFMRHSLATLVAARVGQGLAILFILSGFWFQGNFMLMVIGFFVAMGAQQELVFARMREAARKYRVGEVMQTRYETVPDTLPLAEVSAMLLGSNQAVFPLVNDDQVFCGFAVRDELLDAARRLPGETPVAELGKMVKLLHPDTGLEEALEIMQKSQQPLLPVVDSGDQLVGLVDVDQLMELSREPR